MSHLASHTSALPLVLDMYAVQGRGSVAMRAIGTSRRAPAQARSCHLGHTCR